MNNDEKRYFDNSFADYGGEELLDAPGKLCADWDSRIRQIIVGLLPQLEQGITAILESSDYSVYTGTAGIGLLYFHMYEKLRGPHGEKVSAYLHKAIEFAEKGLTHLKRRKLSFLAGDAGILATSAVFYKAAGRDKVSERCLSELLSCVDDVVSQPEIPDELLFGRGGYLYSLFFIRQHLGVSAVSDETIQKVVSAMVQSGQTLSNTIRSPSPLMYEWHDSYYLGAAHGLAGIFYVLMHRIEHAGAEDVAQMKQLIADSIKFLVSLRLPSGNFPSSIKHHGHGSADKLIQFCHGAGGFAFMFLKAHKIFHSEAFLTEALNCGDVVWKRGLLKKGYGLCHGVAGNAYAFLALYRQTQDLKHLYRALKFAEWMFDYGKHGCRIADRPYSLFEGLAGTLYFLIDLLDPGTAAFPAFEL